MRKLDALQALARLAGPGTTDRVGALSEVSDIIASVIGSGDVRLFAGDGITYEAYPPKEHEDFFGLSSAGLLSASTELRKLGGAGAYSVGSDGLPREVALADGRHAGAYVAFALWSGDIYVGTVVARGPWTRAAAGRAGRFLELAGPTLAAMLEHVVDPDRPRRVQQQMNLLANVTRVFTRAENMQDVLADVVGAVSSATGYISSIDVLDSRGRTAVRSAAAGRYTGTPLHDRWLKMTEAPDRILEMILHDHQRVLLPDLRTDPRLSEEARDFYRAASLVSGATFPLILQDEVVGVLRVGSLKPTSFPPEVVGLLESLAVQAAVIVKGVQLWEELQRSRNETEQYAAKLQSSMEIEHHLARMDHLCGIPNRRYLEEVMAAECARTARHKTPLSLAMADLDDFKLVNDAHGHDAGDEVLRQVGSIARSSCREGDMVGRLGGDEFLFVLTATSLEGGITWADRFRRALDETPLLLRCDTQLHVTASIGVAEADGASLTSPPLLMRRCDEALYAAKASGKNTVRSYHQPLAEAI